MFMCFPAVASTARTHAARVRASCVLRSRLRSNGARAGAGGEVAVLAESGFEFLAQVRVGTKHFAGELFEDVVLAVFLLFKDGGEKSPGEKRVGGIGFEEVDGDAGGGLVEGDDDGAGGEGARLGDESGGVGDAETALKGAIGEGDVLLGLASGGLHSNGFSLVRQLLDEWETAGKFDLLSTPAELNTTLASALLAPTRIYVKPILNLVRDFDIKGIVHVTGGGFAGNVPRILPKGVRARIDPTAWPRPAIFGWLGSRGEISEREMLRVFNCGIGMVVVLPREEAENAKDRLRGLGERAHLIGYVERKQPDEPPLLFEPPPEA